MADETDAATVREGMGPRAKAAAPELERYRPIREIARGGMGRVIEALDTQLQRTVALKEILDEHPEARARFDREVEITARLEHPSIVPLYDAGKSPSGAPFYVMRKVAGDPLDVLIRNADTLDQRLRLLPHVLALGDAVAHAHARGVIHRDIKPTNVLVGELGETVVIDWGLAKLIGEADELLPERSAGGSLHTRVGTVFGTPGFMSPEQLAGDPVDERADVYALGGCLYHVLAGERPTDTLPSFDLAGAPTELVTIAKKAMSHAREDRYLDAGGFSEDLRRFLGGQLVAAHHYPLHTRIGRWLRRHRALVAVVSLALVLAIAGGIWALQRILAEQDRAEDALAREQLRADDLLLFKASAFATTDPTLAAATLQQLREDSPRWATIGPMLVGLRKRGVGYGYPALGKQLRHIEQSPTDERILISALGSAAVIDPIARTRKLISEDRDLTQASWWRDKIVLFGRRADRIYDPTTGATSPAPWPADARNTVLAENGTAFYSNTTPAAFAIDRANRVATLALPEVPRWIECEPSGTFAAVLTKSRVHLVRMTAGGLEEVIALEAPGASVAFDHARRLAITSQVTVIEYDLEQTPPTERGRWTTDNFGRARYVAGELHWWGRDQVRVLDDRPYTVRSYGFTPEAALPQDRIARLVDARTIELVGGRLRQVLRSPEPMIMLAARPERRFVVGGGNTRVVVWDLQDLAVGRTLVPLVDELGFAASDRLLGVRNHVEQLARELRITPSLAVEPVRTMKLRSDIVVRSVATIGLVIAFDLLSRRIALLDPTRVEIEVGDIVAFHATDAASLIVGTRDGTIQRVDRTTGRVIEKLGAVDFPLHTLSGQDGWILAAASDGRFWRRDPHGAITTAKITPWLSSTFHEDGTVYVTRERELLEWPVDGEPIRIVTFAQRLKETGSILRVDERLVVLATEDGALHRIDRFLRIATPLIGGTTNVIEAGGTIAAIANDTLVIADVATGVTYRVVDGVDLQAWNGLAVSPDGKLVAAITPHSETESMINVWRLEPLTRAWVMTATNAIAPERIDDPVGWRP